MSKRFFRKFSITDTINEQIDARKTTCGSKYMDSIYANNIVLMQLLGENTMDDIDFIHRDPVLQEIIGRVSSRAWLHNYPTETDSAFALLPRVTIKLKRAI